MGHFSVLVIGDNARDQIEKFQRMEWMWPFDSRHIVARDCLAERRKEHARAKPNPVYVMDSFASWVKQQYGGEMLMEGETPDFLGRHRWGWFRLDRMGEVVEMYKRVVPYSQWDFFDGTVDWLVLKPGASGWRASEFWTTKEPVLEGAAGIARKGAIDFEAMRDASAVKAGALWDSDDFRWDPLLALPRDDYVRIERAGAICHGYAYVLNDGEIVHPTDAKDYSSGPIPYPAPSDMSLDTVKGRREKFNADMNALLESLPDDTILTAASVHA